MIRRILDTVSSPFTTKVGGLGQREVETDQITAPRRSLLDKISFKFKTLQSRRTDFQNVERPSYFSDPGNGSYVINFKAMLESNDPQEVELYVELCTKANRHANFTVECDADDLNKFSKLDTTWKNALKEATTLSLKEVPPKWNITLGRTINMTNVVVQSGVPADSRLEIRDGVTRLTIGNTKAQTVNTPFHPNPYVQDNPGLNIPLDGNCEIQGKVILSNANQLGSLTIKGSLYTTLNLPKDTALGSVYVGRLGYRVDPEGNVAEKGYLNMRNATNVSTLYLKHSDLHSKLTLGPGLSKIVSIGGDIASDIDLGNMKPRPIKERAYDPFEWSGESRYTDKTALLLNWYHHGDLEYFRGQSPFGFRELSSLCENGVVKKPESLRVGSDGTQYLELNDLLQTDDPDSIRQFLENYKTTVEPCVLIINADDIEKLQQLEGKWKDVVGLFSNLSINSIPPKTTVRLENLPLAKVQITGEIPEDSKVIVGAGIEKVTVGRFDGENRTDYYVIDEECRVYGQIDLSEAADLDTLKITGTLYSQLDVPDGKVGVVMVNILGFESGEKAKIGHLNMKKAGSVSTIAISEGEPGSRLTLGTGLENIITDKPLGSDVDAMEAYSDKSSKTASYLTALKEEIFYRQEKLIRDGFNYNYGHDYDVDDNAEQ